MSIDKYKPYPKPRHSVWLTLLLLPLLASCATTASRGTDHQTQLTNAAACAAFGPICPSKADVLTDGTAKQILAHDKTGAKLCGWTSSTCKGPP